MHINEIKIWAIKKEKQGSCYAQKWNKRKEKLRKKYKRCNMHEGQMKQK
jgi:hypothetical protein